MIKNVWNNKADKKSRSKSTNRQNNRRKEIKRTRNRYGGVMKMEYAVICPKCQKVIQVEVDDKWIKEVANSWWQERRESEKEARD